MRPRARADPHTVICLALVWLALIALWGASETWDVGQLVRRLVRTARVRIHHGASPGVDVGDR